MQRHLTARYSAHNRGYAGSTPVAATKCTDGVTAAPGSPKPLVRVQILVCALLCPNRKSLHTRLMVRQLSLKQSMQVRFLFMNQQLFQLTWHTWCCRQIGKATCLSSRRMRVQVPSALPYGSAHLLAWVTVCKTAAFALLVQFQPGLPKMESKSIRRSALFAKQMGLHLWFESTALRLMRTWCNWITHQSTKLKSEGSSPSVLALSPSSSVGSSVCLKNRRSSVRF